MTRDQILVALAVLGLIVLLIFTLNSVFSNNYSASVHQYDAQFDEIQSEFRRGNYERVEELANLITREDDTGPHDIKAKSYVGLSKLKAGRTDEAITTLRYLTGKYPGIQQVYGSNLAAGTNIDLLEFTFNHILNEYLIGMEKAVTSDITGMKIIEAMSLADWIRVFAILAGSVAIYNRLRTK